MLVDWLGAAFSGAPWSLLSKSLAVVASKGPSSDPSTKLAIFVCKLLMIKHNKILIILIINNKPVQYKEDMEFLLLQPIALECVTWTKMFL